MRFPVCDIKPEIARQIERPDFFLGRPNPWPEAFAEFSPQMASHVGNLDELVAARFSTSTAIEVAAYDVAVMDTFQGYLEYVMMAGCGIPEIELLGTPEDWRSFFRYEGGSGSAELTGWIVTLFPYLKPNEELEWNPYLSDLQARWQRADRGGSHFESDRPVEGPWVGALPGGQASAPVKYIQQPAGTEHALRFIAGHFGVHRDETDGTLSPAFGWAVIHDDANPLRTYDPMRALEDDPAPLDE